MIGWMVDDVEGTQQLLQFDPKGILYRLVASYKMAVCGLLIFHPKVNLIKSDPVGFASTEYGAIEFDPKDLIENVRKENLKLAQVTDSLTYMLINSAYEACLAKYGESKWRTLREKHHELEFFRHIRNAASHGGFFTFKQNEPNPKRIAIWRGRQITQELRGKTLWDANLQPGDSLVFLWDIEQILKAYP